RPNVRKIASEVEDIIDEYAFLLGKLDNAGYLAKNDISSHKEKELPVLTHLDKSLGYSLIEYLSRIFMEPLEELLPVLFGHVSDQPDENVVPEGLMPADFFL
ncbi:hypothetical protein ACJX0J_039564, partial [Zea mays]